MSDEEFDEESFAAYENELYGIQSDSDEDVDSEVEDALYSQVHHSFSATPGEDISYIAQDEPDNGSSEAIIKTADSSTPEPELITISDHDDNDDESDGDQANKSCNTELFIVDEADCESTSAHNSALQQEENWDLIDRDMEDEASGGKRPTSRYYGLDSKQSNIRCRNCNEKGHFARDCTVQRKISCVLCGTSGHIRIKCPKQLCFNCLQPGHRSSDCTKVRVRWTDQCRRCFQSGHHSNTCPDLWRQYHRTIEVGVPPVVAKKTDVSNKTIYCYNCTAKGHYGHECPEERPNDYNSPVFQYIVRYDRHCHFQNDRYTNRKRKYDKDRDEQSTSKHRKTDVTNFNSSYTPEHCNRSKTECRDRGDRRQSWPQQQYKKDDSFAKRIAEKVKLRKKEWNECRETVDAVPSPTRKDSKKKKKEKQTWKNLDEQEIVQGKPKAKKERKAQRKKEKKMNQNKHTESTNSSYASTLQRMVDDMEQINKKDEDKQQSFFGIKLSIKNEHFIPSSSLTEHFSTPDFADRNNSLQASTHRNSNSFQKSSDLGTENQSRKQAKSKKNFATGPSGAKWQKNNKTYDNKSRGFQSKKWKNHTL